MQTSNNSIHNVQDSRQPSSLLSRFTISSLRWKISLIRTSTFVIRSNDTQTQIHTIMYKAFGYSLSWFLSFGVHIIALINALVPGGSYSIGFVYTTSSLMPLQGPSIYSSICIPRFSVPESQGEEVERCLGARQSPAPSDQEEATERGEVQGNHQASVVTIVH